jgi:hypothetical protein
MYNVYTVCGNPGSTILGNLSTKNLFWGAPRHSQPYRCRAIKGRGRVIPTLTAWYCPWRNRDMHAWLQKRTAPRNPAGSRCLTLTG